VIHRSQISLLVMMTHPFVFQCQALPRRWSRRIAQTTTFAALRCHSSQTQKPQLLTTEPHRLGIQWPDGTRQTFHLAWLRDHCPCPSCVHPSHKQKMHYSGHVSPQAEIQSMVLDELNKTLKIQWKPGSMRTDTSAVHSSDFDLTFLKEFKPSQTPRMQQVFWNASDFAKANQPVGYQAFLKDESAFRRVLVQLRDYGLAFMKNVPRNVNQVETVAQRFGPIRETFYGKSWNVKSDPNAKNIAYTSSYLGLHMDLM
jgi:gamma-butyrobetaine dioxygenase